MDAELAHLSKTVEQAFRQATKRFAVPTSADCDMVALYLIMLRQNPKKQRPKAIKFAKLFLNSLEAERREIAEMVSLALSPQVRVYREEWLQEQRELLDRIDQTRRNIEWILPIVFPKPDPNRDSVRLIARVATQAWQEANDGRAPQSKNPDRPLCRFVEAALTAIEQKRSAAAISDTLRDRRRNRKGKNGD